MRGRRRPREGDGARVLDLVNEQRRQAGLRPLKPSRRLRLAARSHARDMARRSYLAHDTKGGRQWWQRLLRTGFKAKGENVARGQDTAAEVVLAWMRSPAHKDNILHRQFTHAGLGIATARDGTRYWCHDFGGR